MTRLDLSARQSSHLSTFAELFGGHISLGDGSIGEAEIRGGSASVDVVSGVKRGPEGVALTSLPDLDLTRYHEQDPPFSLRVRELGKRNITVPAMATPDLEDDGQVVTLDLHGATVDEALDLTYRTLRLAEERGRSRLTLIHGSSTTGRSPTRTIKEALHDLLDQGDLGAHATSVRRSRDSLTLMLDLTASTDPTPIRLRDVWP